MSGKVESPSFILECLTCGKKTEELITQGEVEILPNFPPIKWINRFTEEEMKDGDILPSICPECQALGLTLEIFGEVGPLSWYQEDQ